MLRMTFRKIEIFSKQPFCVWHPLPARRSLHQLATPPDIGVIHPAQHLESTTGVPAR
jgi:hypothetical protein